MLQTYSTTADRLGVKSLQLSEYVEQLKEELNLRAINTSVTKKQRHLKLLRALIADLSSSSTPAQAAPAESLPPTTIDPAQLPHNHATKVSIPGSTASFGHRDSFTHPHRRSITEERKAPEPSCSKPDIQASKPSSSWTHLNQRKNRQHKIRSISALIYQ